MGRGSEGFWVRASRVFAGNPLVPLEIAPDFTTRGSGHTDSPGFVGLHTRVTGFWRVRRVLSHPGHLWFTGSPEIASSAPPTGGSGSDHSSTSRSHLSLDISRLSHLSVSSLCLSTLSISPESLSLSSLSRSLCGSLGRRAKKKK